MTVLAEVIPDAKSLSRADKLRLIQVLAEELATDEAADMQADHAYAVWSPDHAFDAADVMLKNARRPGPLMTLPAVRFPFIIRDRAVGSASLAPMMPLTLTGTQTNPVSALLDTGAAVNVQWPDAL